MLLRKDFVMLAVFFLWLVVPSIGQSTFTGMMFQAQLSLSMSYVYPYIFNDITAIFVSLS